MAKRVERIVEVWRLNPFGCRIVPADATLGGCTPISARRHCGPFIQANRAGFYLYSPVDVDLTYHGDGRWTHEIAGAFWDDSELLTIAAMTNNQLDPSMGRFLPRTKVFLSGRESEPEHTAQLWTGIVFRTPPEWALWLRGPVNRREEWPFRVEEAVLETCWLWQDIWLNLRFHSVGRTAHLRRDGPPIAQIVPMAVDTGVRWRVVEQDFLPGDSAAETVFAHWLQFNREKFGGAQKDSGTYHRWRREHGSCSGRTEEPCPDERGAEGE